MVQQQPCEFESDMVAYFSRSAVLFVHNDNQILKFQSHDLNGYVTCGPLPMCI